MTGPAPTVGVENLYAVGEMVEARTTGEWRRAYIASFDPHYGRAGWYVRWAGYDPNPAASATGWTTQVRPLDGQNGKAD